MAVGAMQSHQPLSALTATPVMLSSKACRHTESVEWLGRIEPFKSWRIVGTLREFLHGVDECQHLRLQILRVWHMAQGLFALALSDGKSYCWALSIDSANLLEIASGHGWNHIMMVDVELLKCAAHDGQPCVFVTSVQDSAQHQTTAQIAQIQDNSGINVRLGEGSWRVFGMPELQVCSLSQTSGVAGSRETVFAAPDVIKRFAHKNVVHLRMRLHSWELSPTQRRMVSMVLTDGGTYLTAKTTDSSIVGMHEGHPVSKFHGWSKGDVLQMRLHLPDALILTADRVALAHDIDDLRPARPQATLVPSQHARTQDLVMQPKQAQDDLLRLVLRFVCMSSLTMCLRVSTRFLACLLAENTDKWAVEQAYALVADRPDLTEWLSTEWPLSTRAVQDRSDRKHRMRAVLRTAMPSVYERISRCETGCNMRLAVDQKEYMNSMRMQPEHSEASVSGTVPFEALAYQLRAFFDSAHPVTRGRGLRGFEWHSREDPTTLDLLVHQVPHPLNNALDNWAIFGVLRTSISCHPSSPHALHKMQVRLHNPGIKSFTLNTIVSDRDKIFRTWKYPDFIPDAAAFGGQQLFRDGSSGSLLGETGHHIATRSSEILMVEELISRMRLEKRMLDESRKRGRGLNIMISRNEAKADEATCADIIQVGGFLANHENFSANTNNILGDSGAGQETHRLAWSRTTALDYRLPFRLFAEAQAEKAQVARPLTRGVLNFVWQTTQKTCEDALAMIDRNLATGAVSVVTGTIENARPAEEWFHLSPYCYQPLTGKQVARIWGEQPSGEVGIKEAVLMSKESGKIHGVSAKTIRDVWDRAIWELPDFTATHSYKCLWGVADAQDAHAGQATAREHEYVRLNLQCCREPILYGKKVFYSVSTEDDSLIHTCVVTDKAYLSIMVHDCERVVWVSSRCPSLAQIIQEVLVGAEQDMHFEMQSDHPMGSHTHYPSTRSSNAPMVSILDCMILTVSLRNPCSKCMLPPTHLFSTATAEQEDDTDGTYVSCMYEVLDCVLLEKNRNTQLGALNWNIFHFDQKLNQRGDQLLHEDEQHPIVPLATWLWQLRDDSKIDQYFNYIKSHEEEDSTPEGDSSPRETLQYTPEHTANSLPSQDSTIVYSPVSSQSTVESEM